MPRLPAVSILFNGISSDTIVHAHRHRYKRLRRSLSGKSACIPSHCRMLAEEIHTPNGRDAVD